MKKATANRGASLTRTQVLRKISRLKEDAQFFSCDVCVASLNDLRDWIKSMDERAAKKPGGLGRKRSGAAK